MRDGLSFLAFWAEVRPSASYFDLFDGCPATSAWLTGHSIHLQHVLVVSAFVVGAKGSDGGSSVYDSLIDDPLAILDHIPDLFLRQFHRCSFRMHPRCEKDLISVNVPNSADYLLIQ